MTTPTVAEVLRGAAPPTPAEILRASAVRVRKGWGRGQFMSPEGDPCAIGAIALTVGALLGGGLYASEALRMLEGRLIRETTQFLHQTLSSVLAPQRIWCVANWNDKQAADAEEVAQMMEKSAAWWEEIHG